MRLLAIVLAALVIAIQWPLWFGKGGWLRVSELQRQVDAQRATNAALSLRNDGLAAEVRSLHEGREAIEERARYELNMIRGDEVFFQFVPAGKGTPAPALRPGARPDAQPDAKHHVKSEARK